MSRVFACLVAVFLVSSAAAAQTIIQGPRDQVLPGATVPPGTPSPQMPARDNPQRTGTARFRGHVFAADNGQPLRRAQVRATSPELRENRMATTDANGAYELKDLPAGRYNLTASKGSFVNLSYGQLRPFEPGKPIEILDGQTIEKLDFSLPRGGVITGRILDEFGDPTADVQVMAMRYQYMRGRRQLTPAGRPGMTNDVGEYRIFGLPPGDYYLSATMRGPGMMMDASSEDRSGYAPTYYPGTGNVAEAQRLTVGIGQVLSDVSISLMPTRTARISGTAVDSEGKPLAGGFITVFQQTGGMMFGGGGGQIRPDGSFTVSNLAPGEYTLAASMGGGFGVMGEAATARVTVAGDDIMGIRLVTVKPSTATGRVVVDPAQAPSVRPSTIRLMAMPARPEDNMPMGPPGAGKVNDDFTFELKVRPGTSLIRMVGGLPGSGVDLKAVRLNGADVTDTGIEFRTNEDISGIEIELTTHPSEVSGLVTNARGEPVKEYSVVIFAQDQQHWGFQSRYLGMGRPDQDGRFKVRNLPPGTYYAVALEYVEPGESSDPEFLEKIRDRASRFSLNDGETKVLDLKLAGGG